MRRLALRIKAGVFWLSAMAGVVVFLLRGRRPKPGLAILCYHRIAENLPAGSPHDPYNVSPKQFARQLDALQSLSSVRVVSVAEVAEWVKTGSTPPGSYLLLTFDDGYQNTLAAARQLQSRGMGGIFFLSTGYMDRPTFECNLYDQWCQELPDANPLWYRPLTWDDCRSLTGMGMDLQPHGHWHRLVGQLERKDMEEEILLSKQAVESTLGCQVKAYAYAGGSGYLNHYNAQVEEFLSQAGFCFALSTDAGTNPPDWIKGNAFHLRRLPVHEHDGGLFFQAKIAGYSGPLPALKSVVHRIRTRLTFSPTKTPGRSGTHDKEDQAN
jgi:peptidoglycan/xylan/chitin deacetylase (PgdA/CDA1 family)